MKISIASFTLRGAELAEMLAVRLSDRGEDARAYAADKYAPQSGLPATGGVSKWTKVHFEDSDALIYVGATGIAVRAIAPCLRSKLTDPAVVCVDEAGRFAVSLVSGHVGGANRLAARVAHLTGGQAVISTATDVNGLFSVDDWIARMGMIMVNPHAVRTLAGILLDGGSIGFASEFPVDGALPGGVEERDSGAAGLYVGVHDRKPFDVTLTAVPRVILLGIGCRRGIAAEAVEDAVDRVLREQNLRPESVRAVASIDIKSNEAGLKEFCARRNLPVSFFSAETLAKVEGTFTPSERVLRVTGVDNVCERAAVGLGGRLIVRKTAWNGVTVAAAMEEIKVAF